MVSRAAPLARKAGRAGVASTKTAVASFMSFGFKPLDRPSDTRQVLWIGSGLSRKMASAFFEQMHASGSQRVEVMALDTTTA
ncbi:hypothetical protein D3C87_1556170 [compost metagenome]|jgi:hypothetical protein